MGGGTAYVASREKDPFLKLFSMGVVNQESCFTCPFRNETFDWVTIGVNASKTMKMAFLWFSLMEAED